MTDAGADPTRVVEVAVCPGPGCGAANPSTYRFCMKCGTKLEAAPPSTAVRPEPPPPPIAPPEVRPAAAPATERVPAPGTVKTMKLSAAPDWQRVCVTRILPSDETESHDIKGEFVVGREEGSLAITSDPFLSRRHFAIRQRSGAYYLTDLDSSNGTYVQVRGEVELRPGDYIMLGGQVFRFMV